MILNINRKLSETLLYAFLRAFIFLRLVFRSERADGSVCRFRSSVRVSGDSLLGDAVCGFVLTDTAIERVSGYPHSTHKVSACDVLGFPFPVELFKLHPVGRDRLSACVFALCLSNLDTLTLTLFELLTLQL